MYEIQYWCWSLNRWRRYEGVDAEPYQDSEDLETLNNIAESVRRRSGRPIRVGASGWYF